MRILNNVVNLYLLVNPQLELKELVFNIAAVLEQRLILLPRV